MRTKKPRMGRGYVCMACGGGLAAAAAVAGQIAGLVKKEQTCQEMIEEMMGQAEALLNR